MRDDEMVDPLEHRCPTCDSVVEEGTAVCVMCGAQLSWPDPEPEAETPDKPAVNLQMTPVEETAVVPDPKPEPVPEIVSFTMQEKQSPLVLVLTGFFAVFIFIMAILVIQYRPDQVSMILLPSSTPVPPTITNTSTWTPLPTETRPPTLVPTITATPASTTTPPIPRSHTVSSGETLIGLSLLYRVSPESILEANNMTEAQPIQVNQNLLVPWPTPTPPLVVVAEEINGEVVLADPANCERYEVKTGDSVAGIANLFGVDFGLLSKVNRLGEDSIVHPGDTICIPEIIYGESLPPTPGPSPTPTATAPPAGPRLLYPVNGTTVAEPDGIVTLQWVAVQDLAESEYYMVQLTDVADLDAPSLRGFTRDTAYQLPSDWRPDVPETRQMRWRVSIVNVTDWRSDGLPIYTFGGEMSADALFNWLGAVPTATQTMTPTPTVTPTP